MLAPTARGVEAVSGGVSHPAHGSPYRRSSGRGRRARGHGDAGVVLPLAADP